MIWIRTCNDRQSKLYRESLDQRWPSQQYSNSQIMMESYESLGKLDDLSLKAVGNVSPTAASKDFGREVREVVSTDCSICICFFLLQLGC